MKRRGSCSVLLGLIVSVVFIFFISEGVSTDLSGKSLIDFSKRLTLFDCLLWAIADHANSEEKHQLQALGMYIYQNDALDDRNPIRCKMRNCATKINSETRQAALDLVLKQNLVLGYFLQDIASGLRNSEPTVISPAYSILQVFSGRAIYRIWQLNELLINISEQMAAEDSCSEVILHQKEQITIALKDNIIKVMDSELRHFLQKDDSRSEQIHQNTISYLDSLLPMGSGSNVKIGTHWVMVSGPFDTDQKQRVILYHELAHLLIHECIANDSLLSSTVANSKCLFNVAMMGGKNFGSYNRWPVYFEEILVRAVSYRLSGSEPLTQYPMEQEIVKSLNSYSPDQTPLSPFLRHMIDELVIKFCH
jgi:hypothetical protein